MNNTIYHGGSPARSAFIGWNSFVLQQLEAKEVSIVFTPKSNVPPASNYAAYDLNNYHEMLDFDDSTDESAVFSSFLQGYNDNGLTVILVWSVPSLIVGAVVWDVAFERIQEDITDLDVDSFAAPQSVTRTVPGTARTCDYASILFTNGAQMDSLANGEAFRVKVTRDANNGSDTLNSDAELLRVVIKETA
jgi:hypothetical protein